MVRRQKQKNIRICKVRENGLKNNLSPCLLRRVVQIESVLVIMTMALRGEIQDCIVSGTSYLEPLFSLPKNLALGQKNMDVVLSCRSQ